MRGKRLTLLIVSILLLSSVPGGSSARADVWAEVDGAEVSVHHTGARYNCCWVIDMELEFLDGLVNLREIEGAGSQYCYCYCDFDLRFDFAIHEPGEWLIQVWHYDAEAVPPGHVLVASLPVTIEQGEDGETATAQSACGGWVTSAPEAPLPPMASPTLSAVKMLYPHHEEE